MWKVLLRDGRTLSADDVECEGGALVLSRRDGKGVLDAFLMVRPSEWLYAEKTDGNSNG